LKKEISQKLKVYTTLSAVCMLVGVLLMIYMIKVEDEPGALPLFLIITGAVWFTVSQIKIKKQVR
jgi:uncharacterized membrane protein YdjX (TVP38/TMEM64 family)